VGYFEVAISGVFSSGHPGDGFKIDPIEVEIHPEYSDKYRILDGAHR